MDLIVTRYAKCYWCVNKHNKTQQRPCPVPLQATADVKVPTRTRERRWWPAKNISQWQESYQIPLSVAFKTVQNWATPTDAKVNMEMTAK